MEQRFHVFVRRHSGGGHTASVLTHPHLAAFAEDIDAARADLATVLARLLARDADGITRAKTFWPDVRLRRVDVTVTALQHERVLPVPMRFSVVTHREALSAVDDDLPLRKSLRARVWVRIPRIDASGWIADESDVEAFVQELVRHELYLGRVPELLDAAFDGEETLETLTVPYRPRKPAVSTTTKKNARPPVPPALAETSRRLDDEFRAGTLDRAFQRDAEVTRLLTAMTSARHGGALLIGPAGAGKTAVVHEAVARIAESDEGSDLAGLEVYTTSGARIVAGMHYLGQWQQRLQKMLDALRVRRSVLHLESLGELLTASHGDQGLDVARYLLPVIESGEIAVVFEATPEEVLRAERSHPALLRALLRIPVEPLQGEGAMRALVSAAARVGRARRVRFAEEALTRAADLTAHFGEGQALPGGAVQLLRAAANADGFTSISPGGMRGHPPARVITAHDVTTAFTRRTGYPREIIDPAVPLDPDSVLTRLRERVVGQDAAMLLLRDLVVTLKTSLSDPSRPLGSFLLLGPTGVGKTESALALAEYLFGDGRRMVRFDMSEYAAPGSATRLVSEYGGAEGPLARRVREQPFGVVLLDEVEKADESVHDLLLQILGEGRLTDATGRTVSFRNTIVMLTSNLGADTAGRSLGFGDGRARDAAAHYLAAATAFFRPELLNRFDHVVPYDPLSIDTVRILARRAISRALSREGLTRRDVRVRYDERVVERIASLGFDPNYGARPLHRAVERWVVAPIARVLAARGAKPPRELELVVRGAGLAVAPTSAPEVARLEGVALADELARRSSRTRESHIELRVRPDGPHARWRGEWLAERWSAWCNARGGEAAFFAGSEPGEWTLRARGGPSALLAFECGLHEFVTDGDAVRVWVRDASNSVQPDAARLYTDQPVESVLDVESGLEFVGSWDDALTGEAMDRFVLARAAEG